MKLKRLPEDFRVEELTEFVRTNSGEFSFYQLTKRGLGTPEAIEAVARRWKLDWRQISFGGLKDRHAITTQFLTIHHGPRRDLRQTNIELDYLGQSSRPFGPADFTGNRFRVVLRSMSEDDVAAAETAGDEIRRDGLPNYFDDQRFGSLGESGEFVARAWIAGDYERALWLALADANPLDRPRDREEKRSLREHWGEWQTCQTNLTEPLRRAVAGHLVSRPSDFRGALARIRPDQRGLYVAAFQSFLWNQLLAAYLKESLPAERLVAVALKPADVPFFTSLDDDGRRQIESAELPLPSSRTRLDAGPVKVLVDRVLADLGLSMREIRIKYPRDSFFSKGFRRVTFVASELELRPEPDELYRGRQKLCMRFDLPRGAYATIVIKRLAASVGQTSTDDSSAAENAEHETTEATL